MPPIVGVASEECFCDWWDAGACSMTQVITEVECILHDVSSSLPEIPRQSELYYWRWWCWVGCLVWGALVCLPYPKRGDFLSLAGTLADGARWDLPFPGRSDVACHYCGGGAWERYALLGNGLLSLGGSPLSLLCRHGCAVGTCCGGL